MESELAPLQQDDDDLEAHNIYGRPLYVDKASWPQVKRLLEFVRPELVWVTGGTIFGFCGTILGLISPSYGGAFLDDVINIRTACMLTSHQDCSIAGAMHNLQLLVLFALLGIAISTFGSMCFAMAGRRVIARTRKDLFQAYLHQDMYFFDVKSVGELISRIGPDVSHIEGACTAFSTLLNAVVTQGGSVVLMFLISSQLGGITLAAFPFYTATSYFGGRIIARLNFICNNLLADQSGYATDILGLISTVRAFGREIRESTIFSTFTDRVYRLAIRIYLANSGISTVDALIALLCKIFFLYYGATLVVRQTISLGQLVAFQTYAGMATSSFGDLSGLYTGLMSMIGGSQVIVALLDAFKHQDLLRQRVANKDVAQQIGVERRGRDASKRTNLAREGTDIEFREVSFCYPARPSQPVLRELSYLFRNGQMTALVGPSGAGKSSLCSLLMRFYEPTGGAILAGGVDIRDFDVSAWRRQIAIVTQDPVLLAGTVAENISYGAENATIEEVHEAARQAGAAEFIEKLDEGYDQMLGRLAQGQTLSGGQRQRISIARAFARDPRILLLDEPTSALDKENEALVIQTVGSMRPGRLVLMITHNLDLIRQADVIMVMAQGNLVESGSHTELMQAKGLYFDFYQHTLSAM